MIRLTILAFVTSLAFSTLCAADSSGEQPESKIWQSLFNKLEKGDYEAARAIIADPANTKTIEQKKIENFEGIICELEKEDDPAARAEILDGLQALMGLHKMISEMEDLTAKLKTTAAEAANWNKQMEALRLEQEKAQNEKKRLLQGCEEAPQSQDHEKRKSCVIVLSNIFDPTSQSYSNDFWLKLDALKLLSKLSPDNVIAAPILLEALATEPRGEVHHIVSVLRKMDTLERSKLVPYIGHSNPIVRSGILHFFKGDASPDAVEILLKATKDEDARVRASALEVIKHLPEVSRSELFPKVSHELLPGFVSLLEHRDPEQRAAAIDGIRLIRPGSDEIRKQLLAMLADSNESVSSAAVKAIGEMQIREGIAPLISKLATHHESYAISFALKQLAPESVPLLIEALKSPNDPLQIGAAQTLRIIGAAAKEAIPLLSEIENQTANDPNKAKLNLAVKMAIWELEK